MSAAMAADLKEAETLLLPFAEKLERMVLAYHLSLPASGHSGAELGFSRDSLLGRIHLYALEASQDYLTWSLSVQVIREDSIQWCGDFLLQYAYENGELKRLDLSCDCFTCHEKRRRESKSREELCEGTPIPEELKMNDKTSKQACGHSDE